MIGDKSWNLIGHVHEAEDFVEALFREHKIKNRFMFADRNGSTMYEGELLWHCGDKLAVVRFKDGTELVIKVEPRTNGYRLRYRGADLLVHVLSPRQAELVARMPVKTPPDTSKMLLCPMPGLIVKVDVEEGQEVQEGQALCTVEAMKMENILRAEKKGIVAKINAGPGDSLAVDDVIMEFE